MDAPPVQYVKTSDGFNIAYSVTGEGEPLVSMPWPINHLDALWNSNFIKGLAGRCRLIQYDGRGQGLSTRGLPDDLSLEDYERDLEAVLDRLQVQRAVLSAHGQFGHVAVRFAARRPERVNALILGSCRVDRTVRHRGLTAAVELAEANWDLFIDLYRAQFLTYWPEIADTFLGLREMSTQADWLKAMSVFNESNIETTCSRLDVPTLVATSDIPGSPMNQVEDAKALAALMPRASLVIFRGDYVPNLLSAIDDFLGKLPPVSGRQSATAPPDGLSPRELDVLRLVAAGRSNRQIADELVISLNTVQNHVSNILSKTGLTNRTEAASYAHDHGLLPLSAESD
jgi:DNA-binding CsgD family transcriptional regulator/pimeloyl-ACP methyl ester carboxylesterase